MMLMDDSSVVTSSHPTAWSEQELRRLHKERDACQWRWQTLRQWVADRQECEDIRRVSVMMSCLEAQTPVTPPSYKVAIIDIVNDEESCE